MLSLRAIDGFVMPKDDGAPVDVALVPVARGRFALQVGCDLELVEKDTA